MSRPRYRFPCGTRILGTIIKPPEDFDKPVVVLTDLSERELVPGQEELVKELKERISRDNGYHRYWTLKSSDFFGTPAPRDYGIKLEYRDVIPTGVVITPKWIRGSNGMEIYDGQMGFPATFVRYRDDLPGLYNIDIGGVLAVHAEFILSKHWQRFAGQPHLYTT